ncbi:MAG: hypothetical protein ACP5P9_05490, partial [Acidimicrobiales bacterium]
MASLEEVGGRGSAETLGVARLGVVDSGLWARTRRTEARSRDMGTVDPRRAEAAGSRRVGG